MLKFFAKIKKTRDLFHVLKQLGCIFAKKGGNKDDDDCYFSIDPG